MARTVLAQLAIELGIDTKDLEVGLRTATERVQQSTNTMKSRFRELGRSLASLKNVLIGAFSVYAVRNFIEEANKAQSALLGLRSVARFRGIEGAEEAVRQLEMVRKGLVSLYDAQKALQNLLMRGYTLEQAITLLNRLGDAAAFGRQGHLSLGEAIVSATEGLKNENSILVDNAGVTKNVAQMWKEYAERIGVGVNQLTLAQKREAEYIGILRETQAQVGNLSKLSETAAGAQARFTSSVQQLKAAIGTVLGTAIRPFIARMADIAQALANLPESTQQFGVALAGLAGAVYVVARAFSVLQISLGPIGWAIMGIVAAATALYAAWRTNVWGLRDKTVAVLKVLKVYFVALWETVRLVARNLPIVIRNAFNLVINYFRVLWTVIKDFSGRFAKVMGGIGEILKGVFTLDPGRIKAGFAEVASAVKDDWSRTFQDIREAATANLQPLPGLKEIWAKAGEEAGRAWAQAKQKAQEEVKPPPPPKPPRDEVDETRRTEEEKAEIERRLAELRVANIRDEFQRKRAQVQLWYEEQIREAKGHAELIAEIEKQKEIRLERIEREELEFRREQYGERLQDYLDYLRQELSATDVTEARKKAIKEEIERTITEIERRQTEARIQLQEEVSFRIQGALAGYQEQFRNMLLGQQADWQSAYEQMREYFTDMFVDRVIQGISDTVSAWVVGEHAKQMATMKTVAVAVAGAAKTVWANLKGAASAIYHAIAEGMKWLVSKLGPLGLAAGIALGAGIIAVMSQFKKAVGLAKGGRVRDETLAVLAEEGPEIVAPEEEFRAYVRRLVRQEAPVGLEVARAIRESLQEVTVGVRAVVQEIRMLATPPALVVPMVGTPEVPTERVRGASEAQGAGGREIHFHLELVQPVVDNRAFWEEVTRDTIRPVLSQISEERA